MKRLQKLPCLILTYKRIKGLERILNKLIENGHSSIYVAIDGPRNEVDKQIQKEMMILIEKYMNEKVSINILRREENLGIGVAVISAIDWFYSLEEKGIIIEDDLDFNSNFLNYMNLSINRIDISRDILMVTGTNVSLGKFSQSEFLSNYPMIWGWATTKNAWGVMRQLLLQDKHIKMIELIDKPKQYFFAGSKRSLNGKIDTWDLPIAYEFIKNRKYCLVPPINLVSNIGFDEFSSHTQDEEFPLNLEIQTSNNQFINRDFKSENISQKNREYDKYLEDRVFKITNRHYLVVFKYLLTDGIRNIFKREEKKFISALSKYENEISLF